MNYQFHEIADIFPLMSDDGFSALVQDIKTNGQIEPIWTCGEKIIDGRNRYNACRQLEIEPQTIEWIGEEKDLVPFIVSLNLHRRHLNESQRAMVAAKLVNIQNGGDRKSNQKQNFNSDFSLQNASDLLNVSKPTIISAKKVQQKATPELAEQVNQGNIAVSAAALVAELPEAEQKEIVAKGEKEILETARAIRAQKAEERKQNPDPDAPVDSNREKTISGWQKVIERMGWFLLSARTESTIELSINNLNERERNSFFTSAIRFRNHLNQWIEVLENKGAVNYDPEKTT